MRANIWAGVIAVSGVFFAVAPAPSARGDEVVQLWNVAVRKFVDIDRHAPISGRSSEAVILADRAEAGTYWELSRREGQVVLENQAATKFKGWTINVDCKTGAVIVSERREPGSLWELVDFGEGEFGFRVRADCPYKGLYLDVDARRNCLMLNKDPVRGARWVLKKR